MQTGYLRSRLPHLEGKSWQKGAHLAFLFVQPDDGDNGRPNEPPRRFHVGGTQRAGGLLHNVVFLKASAKQHQIFSLTLLRARAYKETLKISAVFRVSDSHWSVCGPLA